MAELKLLCIHCADTNPNFDLKKKHLDQWHKGPKDLRDSNGKKTGVVRYLGKDYQSRAALPLHFLGGKPIAELRGRGWDRLGYSDLIHNTGTIENITSYDQDDWVDPKEMTWGVSGINSFTRHICMEGGRNEENESRKFNFADIFTDAQFTSLTSYINQFLRDHPGDKIAGHYMFSTKSCPNFAVEDFFALSDIDIKHLYKP